MKVDCDFKKWGDRQHYRFDMDLLGRDEFGTWLGGRGPVTVKAGPRAPFDMEHNFVTLFPADGWWIASFNDPVEIDIYVDIATTPVWLSDAHVTSVDLDLDVIRYASDGRVLLVDEDEFDDHRTKYGYPDDIVRRARATSEEIVDAVTSRREPFGEVGFAWLAKL